MKNKFNFIIGVLAWLLALANIACAKLLPIDFFLGVSFPVIPGLWVLAVSLMFIFGDRKIKHTWWVLLSAPLVFVFWVILFGMLAKHG